MPPRYAWLLTRRLLRFGVCRGSALLRAVERHLGAAARAGAWRAAEARSCREAIQYFHLRDVVHRLAREAPIVEDGGRVGLPGRPARGVEGVEPFFQPVRRARRRPRRARAARMAASSTRAKRASRATSAPTCRTRMTGSDRDRNCCAASTAATRTRRSRTHVCLRVHMYVTVRPGGASHLARQDPRGSSTSRAERPRAVSRHAL